VERGKGRIFHPTVITRKQRQPEVAAVPTKTGHAFFLLLLLDVSLSISLSLCDVDDGIGR
jgi:hypothetical protein